MDQHKEPPRRSLRLRQKQVIQQQDKPPLPSPTPTTPPSRKRRRPPAPNGDGGDSPDPPVQDIDSSDPVAVWAHTAHWPTDLAAEMPAARMSPPAPSAPASTKVTKKTRTSTAASSSHYAIAIKKLAEDGVEVYRCNYGQLKIESQRRIREYRQGDRTPQLFPSFLREDFAKALELANIRNEFRLQRDITPLIVPSPELLFLAGQLDVAYLSEEICQEWSLAASLGGKISKPDHTVGLLSAAFSPEELKKLQAYATNETPAYVTHLLLFPFLNTEVKTGRGCREAAEIQNSRSGAIATRAVFDLVSEAYGKSHQTVRLLYNEILTWTIYHDSNIVVISGHLPVEAKEPGQQVKIRRFESDTFQLNHPAQRYRAFNFVWNLYTKFAPLHLKRIKDAIAQLPLPAPTPTRLQSESIARETESDAWGSQSAGAGLLVKQVEQMRNQLLEMRESNEKKEEFHKKELKEEKEKAEQERKKAEQARKEMRDRMERMEQDRKEEREKAELDRKEEREKAELDRKEEREKAELDRKEEREKAELDRKTEREELIALLSKERGLSEEKGWNSINEA